MGLIITRETIEMSCLQMHLQCVAYVHRCACLGYAVIMVVFAVAKE